MALRNGTMENVVAMDVSVVDNESPECTYVLQIVNRNLDNEMKGKVNACIEAEKMANTYGNEPCICEKAEGE